MLLLGDCLEQLKTLPDNSVDSVVTDPPYGLSFMGKKWDYDVPSVEIWREVLRVLKPGGHLLRFGGTRTYHRMVVNIEDAGFEIRDQVTWLYGSGFPKSMDVSKQIDKQAGAAREVTQIGQTKAPEYSGKFDQASSDMRERRDIPATPEAIKWQGWGTALKPANEPICVARKPLEKGLTVAQNVLKWGTGAMNIDASRIDLQNGETTHGSGKSQSSNPNTAFGDMGEKRVGVPNVKSSQGRWPANLLLDEEAAKALDEQVGQDVSKFFYCAKASKRERNAGCQELITWENQDRNLQGLTEQLSQLVKGISEDTMLELSAIEWTTLLHGNIITDQSQPDFKSTTSTVLNLITELRTLSCSQHLNTNESILDAIRTSLDNGLNLAGSAEVISVLRRNTTSEKMGSVLGAVSAVLQTLSKISALGKQGNVHSTVKPIKLMEYLIKLVTPAGGIVLDCFLGSGTTCVAAKKLGFKYIGIEKEIEYFQISEKRISAIGEK